MPSDVGRCCDCGKEWREEREGGETTGRNPRQAWELNHIIKGNGYVGDQHDEERLANQARRHERQIRHHPEQDDRGGRDDSKGAERG